MCCPSCPDPTPMSCPSLGATLCSICQYKEEVYKFFKDKKFEFIQPESFSFRDQIQIFFSAKKIAGLHGAGFANICFWKPETEIIEFKTITTGMNSGNIALKTNLNYRGIICDAVNKLGGSIFLYLKPEKTSLPFKSTILIAPALILVFALF